MRCPSALLALTVAVAIAFAQGRNNNDSGKRHVTAARMAKPPVLDGVLDEPGWNDIEPASDFVQQEPREGDRSTERTEIRFGYDDENLYVGVICFDTQPDRIVVTQNRRDALLTDTDSLQILLDTFDDGQNGFVFGTSPTGIEYDGQISKAGQGRGGVGTPNRAGQAAGQATQGASAQSTGRSGTQRGGATALNVNWDGVWRVRSRITGRGWESELVIPFKTLRYLPGSDRTWGLNVTRNIRRKNEQTFWSAIPRGFTFNQIDMAGKLEGLELRSHRNLKLIPYFLGGIRQNFQAVDQTTYRRTGGADIKTSLTPSLTLDATFNTDFAEVEVDDEQINLTRFDLFFPEKRPFFLENSGIFEFGTAREVEIFFSRRIGIDESGAQVPIDAGARVSGKIGKFQVGMLDMKTRSLGGITTANNFAIVRASRELPNRSSIGMIVVDKEALGREPGVNRNRFNRTFGADANFGIGRRINVFNYFARTQTPGRHRNDHAYSSSMTYNSERHRIDLGFTEVGENFNPEVGFVRRLGYRRPTIGYGHTHYPASRRIREIYPHFQFNRWYTRSTNDKESGFEHYHFETRWQDGEQLGVAFNRSFERLDRPFEVSPGIFIRPGRYPFHEMVINYATDPTAALFAAGNIALGGFYDGDIKSMNINGGYRRGSNLTWTGSYVRNWIDLPAGAFKTDLVGLRFNWSLTPKSYFQLFTQYNSRSEQVGINARLALLSTSSTGLFVVYNSRQSTFDYTDPHEIQRHTLSRALIVKFNYLFDF